MIPHIGLWGPRGSGKTTLLAALERAAPISSWSSTDCTATAQGPVALAFRDGAQRQWLDGRFPAATRNPSTCGWRVYGTSGPVAFADFRVSDRPGADFELGSNADLGDYRDCAGFVYLHDLSRPFEDISRLTAVLAQHDGSRRRKQHLAVCLVKFDHPGVFGRVRDKGFVPDNGHHRMRYEGNPTSQLRMEKLFESLADGRVVNELRDNFDPLRTRYYLTSAVGFRRDINREFSVENYSRVVLGPDGLRVIPDIEPMNVLEPLIDLHDAITRDPPWT